MAAMHTWDWQKAASRQGARNSGLKQGQPTIVCRDEGLNHRSQTKWGVRLLFVYSCRNSLNSVESTVWLNRCTKTQPQLTDIIHLAMPSFSTRNLQSSQTATQIGLYIYVRPPPDLENSHHHHLSRCYTLDKHSKSCIVKLATEHKLNHSSASAGNFQILHLALKSNEYITT